MQIINSLSAVMNAFPDGVFNLKIWKDYASTISSNLVLKCESDSKEYDYQNEVLPVITSALSNQAKMNILNDAFEAVTMDLSVKLTKLFDKEIELQIILYLGLCNGAGWATTLDGNDVILLGIEKIIELDWYNKESIQALIFHEIGHIWHKTYGNLYFSINSENEKSILKLYQEGIATVCEQILCDDNAYYHQDKNGWLFWCMQNKALIKQEYLSRLNSSKSTQDFFGDWCSYKGYSDVGYYLGCEYIKYMKNKYSMNEIANLSYNALLDEFICFAN